MRRTAWSSILAAAALACALVASPAGARTERSSHRVAVSALEAQVLAEINTVRTRNGLVALRFSTKLAAAADQHSLSMARRGYFTHESADGTPFWKRVQRYYGSSHYGFWSVGENLLWASPSVDSAGAVRMWMQSPEHRKVMLTAQWREIGLSAVHVASAPGTYGGQQVTIVTADFGVRR